MSLIFITGAGLSANSGIPTYRGEEDSKWNNKDLMSLMSVDSLSTKEGYLAVKDHLNHWKKEVSSKDPNQGHYEITELIETYGGLVLTQNVDNLHEKSGLDPKYILHLHGSLFVDREGEPNFPDVVLFGENVKEDFSVVQSEILNDCDATIIIGTSLNVLTPYWYINWDKPVIVCNKEYGFKIPDEFVPPQANVYYFYGDIESVVDDLYLFLKREHII